MRSYLDLRKNQDLSTICYNASPVNFPETVDLPSPSSAFLEEHLQSLRSHDESPPPAPSREQEKQVICFACGTLNKIGDHQCQSCGSKLRKNRFSAGNMPPAIKNISAMVQPAPAKKNLSDKEIFAAPVAPQPTGQIAKRQQQLSPQSPKRKIPIVTPGMVNSDRTPILLTPDKRVKGKPLAKKAKNKFIAGAMIMPLAMMPLAKVLSIPWHGYIIDIIFGAMAQIFMGRRSSGGLSGSIIFALACLFSLGSKYAWYWIDYSFSGKQWRHIIIVIVLAMLLGNILGLSNKKKPTQIYLIRTSFAIRGEDSRLGKKQSSLMVVL